MTDEQREAIATQLADLFLLTAEMAMANIAKVVAGEKRVALVPRRHPKAGLIQEFRLTTPPPVKVAPEPRDDWALTEDELAGLPDAKRT